VKAGYRGTEGMLAIALTNLPYHLTDRDNPHSVTAEQIGAATVEQLEDLAKKGGINPNLLDNWYFGNPVNQRGQTSYSGSGYGIDRWKSINDTSSYSLSDEGLSVTAGNFCHVQLLENVAELVGKTVTVSIFFQENTATTSIAISRVVGGTTASPSIVAMSGKTKGVLSGTFVVEDDLEGICISNTPAFDGSIKIVAAKLELGSQQTLAHQDDNGNWVLNEIPNYGEQLIRCKRFYRVCNGGLVGVCLGGFSYFYLPQDVPMRTAPSISVITLGTVRCAGKSLPIMNFLLGGVLGNVIIFTTVHESDFDLDNNACALPHQTSFALEADL
jgi:hypothetical protein